LILVIDDESSIHRQIDAEIAGDAATPARIDSPHGTPPPTGDECRVPWQVRG
jgi:hypothetical protein